MSGLLYAPVHPQYPLFSSLPGSRRSPRHGPCQVSLQLVEAKFVGIEYVHQGPYVFADVREEIRERLQLDKGYGEFVSQLRKQAHVDIKL